jgi:hypothetical protein
VADCLVDIVPPLQAQLDTQVVLAEFKLRNEGYGTTAADGNCLFNGAGQAALLQQQGGSTFSQHELDAAQSRQMEYRRLAAEVIRQHADLQQMVGDFYQQDKLQEYDEHVRQVKEAMNAEAALAKQTALQPGQDMVQPEHETSQSGTAELAPILSEQCITLHEAYCRAITREKGPPLVNCFLL